MGQSSSTLHSPAEKGDLPEIRVLLNDGADPNLLAGYAKWTPLMHAAYGDQTGAIRLLLEIGAEIEKATPRGWFSGEQRAVHIAADHGNAAALGELLDCGAEINAKDQSGWTALHYAARNASHGAALELLLERGANVASTTSAGQTPLDLALSNSATQNIQAILPRVSDSEASKALRSACHSNDSALVSLICARVPEKLPVSLLQSELDSLHRSQTKSESHIESEEQERRTLEAKAEALQRIISELEHAASTDPEVAFTHGIAQKHKAEAETIKFKVSWIKNTVQSERETCRKRGDVIAVLEQAVQRRLMGIGQRQRSVERVAPPVVNPAIEPSAPDLALSPTAATESQECQICLERAKSAALIPCGHLFCLNCAETVKNRGNGCPMCRARVKRVLRVFG